MTIKDRAKEIYGLLMNDDCPKESQPCHDTGDEDQCRDCRVAYIEKHIEEACTDKMASVVNEGTAKLIDGFKELI